MNLTNYTQQHNYRRNGPSSPAFKDGGEPKGAKLKTQVRVWLGVALLVKEAVMARKENKTNGEKRRRGNEKERDRRRQRGLIALC